MTHLMSRRSVTHLIQLIYIFFFILMLCIGTNNILLYIQEYIHRVGRTARGEGAKGHALLFLLPEEISFLAYLKVCYILCSQ
jgi:hypothetical protein